jgi:hypothetical protein
MEKHDREALGVAELGDSELATVRQTYGALDAWD